MDGDPAHEQLNDLRRSASERSSVESLTDLREHILGGTASSKRRSRVQVGQPLIESLEFPFHVCGDGVELDLGELAAGVEVDGALAAILGCVASGDE